MKQSTMMQQLTRHDAFINRKPQHTIVGLCCNLLGGECTLTFELSELDLDNWMRLNEV